MSRRFDYLIVGGGMAADAAYTAIRRRAPEASVQIISEEKFPPYQRPPLSKKLWSDLRMEEIWCASARSDGVTLTARVVRLDPTAHIIQTATGSRYTYGKLLLATGGSPLRLSDFGAAEDPGVVYFRTMDDYLVLRRASDSSRSIVVVGGGFIGAEIAAALTQNGKTVTMVFPESAVLGRILPQPLAQYVTRVYEEEGVAVRTGAQVTSVRQTVRGYEVSLDTGATLLADLVVAGLGIRPNVELARKAGIKTADGIVVDSYLRTSAPDIYAAGDVAMFPWSGAGPLRRVEHEDNAVSQGRTAARNMIGEEQPYTHTPFFYSDLFHLGFEAIGRLDPQLEVYADWTTPNEEGVMYYLDDHRVAGILNWNVWNGIPEARRILAAQEVISDPAKLHQRIRNH